MYRYLFVLFRNSIFDTTTVSERVVGTYTRRYSLLVFALETFCNRRTHPVRFFFFFEYDGGWSRACIRLVCIANGFGGMEKEKGIKEIRDVAYAIRFSEEMANRGTNGYNAKKCPGMFVSREFRLSRIKHGRTY